MGGKRTYDTSPKTTATAVRRLNVTTSDLDQAMGKSKTGFVGVGKSTYATIRQTLAEYERAKQSQKPGAEAKLVTLLERLDLLCTDWINTHRGNLSPQDATRRTLFMRLSEELAEERASLSQKQAQDEYLAALAADQTMRDNEAAFAGEDPLHAVPAHAHKFQAASNETRALAAKAQNEFSIEKSNQERSLRLLGGSGEKIEALEKRMELVRKKRITAAEHAAIIAYTASAGDYGYMNAAAANSKGWMASVKTGAAGKAQGWGAVSDKTLREEGSLHTAMAMSGLKKLDPYEGVSYRGETVTQNDLGAIAAGNVKHFPNLQSTSKDQSIALKFAGEGLSETRDIALLWAFENGGGNARDVEVLSALTGEGEVLLLAGSAFAIFSVVEIGAPGAASKAGAQAGFYNAILARVQTGNLKTARKCFLVQAFPAPTKKVPLPPLPAAPAITRT